MGICPNVGGITGTSQTCVKSDRCFVNYKTWQQTQDNDMIGSNDDINITVDNVNDNCPYAHDTNNDAGEEGYQKGYKMYF